MAATAPVSPPEACRPRRVAPASRMPRRRSGQHSYNTEWHAQRDGVGPPPTAPAADSSSTMIWIRRCRSWGCMRQEGSFAALLERGNLRKAADVSRLAHRGLQERIDDVERLGL